IGDIGKGTKLLYCVFDAEEALTVIPVFTPLKISVFGKATLSRMVSATKYIYGEEYVNALTDLGTLKEYLTHPFKLSANSDPERGQIVKNCLELLVLDNIKPAYRSIKAEFGDEQYMYESEKLAEKLTSYISRDLGREMTLDELSEKFFFSKSYIKKAYKKQTGVSIMQARMDFKIKKAKKMLIGGEKIRTISDKLGFSSVNHFSSAFKKKTGISPTEYKKSLHF
ncbi:MAG: helix-turn-helix transcriptional regulator, partial [Clostridia bacterium]|nr:helix-turn-helix transcriptional regulator [Clostridia bacterium]